MRGQLGFFDVDERLRRLSDLGDHLEAFQSAIDFEVFRADLIVGVVCVKFCKNVVAIR